MPFTFKLAKRLALSKAVRTTATRALSALRQASTGPAVLAPASPYIRHAVAEQTTSLVVRPVVPETPLLRSLPS